MAPLDGCEGVLVTDRVRSRGRILVSDRRGPRAARFGIAHELGHFLLERHVLTADHGFDCLEDDMRERSFGTRQQRQETEANAFAIGLLAPRHLTAPLLSREPGMDLVIALASRLDISREAAGRHLVETHDEPLAIVFSREGVVRYVIRGDRFPWIERGPATPVSTLSRTSQVRGASPGTCIAMEEVAPSAWTMAGIPELFEQVRIGRDGFVTTLLWATLPETVEDP